MSSPVAEITVEGVPVLSNRILKPSDPVFSTLSTMDDYCRLARELRGPFAIVVKADGVTTVVTDFGGLFPVYYLRDDAAGLYRISPRLNDLRPFTSGEIARRALFWNAWRGGIGIDPMYAEVRMVSPARVVRFSGLAMESAEYLDWTTFLGETPISMEEAHERMVEIASSYLRPLMAEGRPACLLSGGTDSALVAWLLKQIRPDVICLSADYAYKRYSEWDSAVAIAARIALRHERVLVRRSDDRRAFLAMNSTMADAPAGHSQLTSLHRLAECAVAKDLRYLFTGDNAGAIFLEFSHFFAGFPKTTAGYMDAIQKLTPIEKLARISPAERIKAERGALLECFDLEVSECQQWIDELRQNDLRMFEPWAKGYGLPALMQVGGQIWGSVTNQNCWLPAQQSVGRGTQLLSPFLDIEMIRFAMTLPVPLKYHDGISKFILIDLLERRTGIRLPKRASPNPSRIWNALPDLAGLSRVDRRLRAHLAGLMARNVASLGRRHQTIRDTTALGLWLQAHRMGPVAAGY